MLFENASNIQAATFQVRNGGFYGSGILLDKLGHVATCAHVVEGRRRGSITLWGDSTLRAKYTVVGTGEESGIDVAVLESRPNLADVLESLPGFRLPTFATKPNLVPGSVIAICGYPGPITNTESREVDLAPVTLGVISKHRASSPVMISAALYGGNSGGPCFSENGNVIGIVSAGYFQKATRISRTRRRMVSIPLFYGEMHPTSEIKTVAEDNEVSLNWRLPK